MKVNWTAVHELDQVELDELAEKHEVDLEGKVFSDLEDAADFVCKELNIKKPADDGADDETKKHRAKAKADEDAPKMSAGEAVNALTEKYIEDHPGTSYSRALEVVLRQDPELRALYEAEFSGGTSPRNQRDSKSHEVSLEINRRAHKLLDAERTLFRTYAEAEAQVLFEDPSLAKQYAEWLAS
jgi:hypothetical protein